MKSKYSLPQDGGLIIEGTPKDIIHRYEKIPTSIFESEGDGVNYVADMIVEAIREHEENGGKRLFALGLTTGQTYTVSWLSVISAARCRFRALRSTASTSSIPSRRPSSRAATIVSTRIS